MFLYSVLIAHMLAATWVVARPSYPSERDIYSKKLSRRDEYITSSGSTPQNTPSMNITVHVPLNSVASSNGSLTSNNIRIPSTPLVATPFSDGGGHGEIISNGAFAGKMSGGGTRNEIYGTARYGSGYGVYITHTGGQVEYMPEPIFHVAGRDFPHGFPPLSWGNYSGGYEYFNASYDNFPGATQRTIDRLSGQPLGGKVMGMLAKKGDQFWFILGDGATLDVLNSVLQLPSAQGGCGTQPFTPQSMSLGWQPQNPVVADRDAAFYESDRLIESRRMDYTIHPWNVVQYYRGSSVALGNLTYDNLYAHDGNSNIDYWAQTSLNTTGVDMDFLNCLNHTIAAAIPIINPSLKVVSRTDHSQVSAIVVGVIVGVLLLVAGSWFFIHRHQKKRAGLTKNDSSWLLNPLRKRLSTDT